LEKKIKLIHSQASPRTQEHQKEANERTITVNNLGEERGNKRPSRNIIRNNTCIIGSKGRKANRIP